MTAIELLKQDHQEALELIESLELTEDQFDEEAELDSEAFPRLQTALKLHTQLEEEVFYPALENFHETRELIKEAYRAHEQVDELLTQLAALTPTQEDFQEMLAELRDSLEQHIEEEEGEIFPKAEDLCGQQKLQEMGRQMEAIKRRGQPGIAATAKQR